MKIVTLTFKTLVKPKTYFNSLFEQISYFYVFVIASLVGITSLFAQLIYTNRSYKVEEMVIFSIVFGLIMGIVDFFVDSIILKLLIKLFKKDVGLKKIMAVGVVASVPIILSFSIALIYRIKIFPDPFFEIVDSIFVLWGMIVGLILLRHILKEMHIFKFLLCIILSLIVSILFFEFTFGYFINVFF